MNDDTYEIWSRVGPGDSFHYIMDVVLGRGFSHREALDAYAEHAGGPLAHKYFLVRLKGSKKFRLFRIVDKPSFMEI